MIKQGTIEWFNQRIGSVTASQVANVVARTKTGTSEKRKRYLYEIVAERLTGKSVDVPVTAAMQRGIDLEPMARDIFAKTMKDFEVTEAEFYKHPTIKYAGASPDGLIGKFGLLEIKCLGQVAHSRQLAEPNKILNKDHELQMLWQQACQPERMFSIYLCYNPDFPVKQQLFVQKIHRDNKKIQELEVAVQDFLEEVEETLTKIKGE
jgi:hypothetical protein